MAESDLVLGNVLATWSGACISMGKNHVAVGGHSRKNWLATRRKEKDASRVLEACQLTLVTKLPAPITHPEPMVTPPSTVTPPPIQQSSPMKTDLPMDGTPQGPLRFETSAKGSVDEKGLAQRKKFNAQNERDGGGGTARVSELTRSAMHEISILPMTPPRKLPIGPERAPG
jgi:hypothetical protein